MGGPKHFLDVEHFVGQNGQKECWVKKLVSQKNTGKKIFFGRKKCVVPSTFESPKNFLPQKRFFGPNIFLGQNIFLVPKTFLAPKKIGK